MNSIKRILVAAGDADMAGRAVARAAMLSVELHAETLELLEIRDTRLGLATPATSTLSTHVDMPALAVLAGTSLHGTRLPVQSGDLACMRSIREGRRAWAITGRAKEIGADLTVVAARRRKRMADFFAQDGVDETMHLSERPLLVVRSRPESGYARVLVATDFSGHAADAARVALLIAPGAHFTMLHACHLHEDKPAALGLAGEHIESRQIRACEQARAELGRFISGLGPRKQLIARSVHYGLPLPVIREYARRLRPDLIVIGKRGRSDAAGLLPGRVATRLAGQVPCDLLIVAAHDIDRWHDRPAA